MATSKEVLDAAARVSAYILKLEATIAEDADTIIKLTKRYVEQQAENKALREAGIKTVYGSLKDHGEGKAELAALLEGKADD